jgi:hypothetical protein
MEIIMKYNLQKTYKIREKIFAFYLDGCIAKEKKKSCFLWDYFLFHKIFLLTKVAMQHLYHHGYLTMHL